jgi:Macrocin-O-methyltransferase (TylF)
LSEEFSDGRRNFEADDNIEALLDAHFEQFDILPKDIWRNFSLYTRRTFLKRFLSHYELFRRTINLPGDIVEFGVYRGASLMAWANFLEIRNMGDRQKRVFGFDNFAGFGELTDADGPDDESVGKTSGGFSSEDFEAPLRDVISIFDRDRFIPYKDRIVLIKGDIEETLPRFVEEHSGIRISLLHFDVDLYRPTILGLELLWDLVVPGGVVAFDEYGIAPWEGESKAVDEFFADRDVTIQRFDWCSNPGGFIVK